MFEFLGFGFCFVLFMDLRVFRDDYFRVCLWKNDDEGRDRSGLG